MVIIPPYIRIYQQILKDLENALPFLNVPKAKAGRKPKNNRCDKGKNKTILIIYIVSNNF